MDATARAGGLALNGARLQLTGGFALSLPGPVDLPHGVQRLVAFVALARGRVSRDRLGGVLWAEVGQSRADGNLRSALWRLRQAGPPVIDRQHESLTIAEDVVIDVLELTGIADTILEGSDVASADLDRLAKASDLLPHWDEPWLVPERERLRQLRLHALEHAGRQLLAAGEFGRAIDLGLAAVETEPYRESAYRLLVEAHLDEGNVGEAARQYVTYRRLATEELGVGPSARMEQLVEPIRPALREDPAARVEASPVGSTSRRHRLLRL